MELRLVLGAVLRLGMVFEVVLTVGAVLRVGVVFSGACCRGMITGRVEDNCGRWKRRDTRTFFTQLHILPPPPTPTPHTPTFLPPTPTHTHTPVRQKIAELATDVDSY